VIMTHRTFSSAEKLLDGLSSFVKYPHLLRSRRRRRRRGRRVAGALFAAIHSLTSALAAVGGACC